MTMEEKQVIETFKNRLIDEVRADSLLDYLIMHRIISLEDSAEVFSSLETGGQMRKLIDILTNRVAGGDQEANNPQVFDEFLNSLKPKYRLLCDAIKESYEQLMEESIAKKPDALENFIRLLADLYNIRYSEYNSISWYPSIKTDIEEFAKPMKLLDENAKEILVDEISEMFHSNLSDKTTTNRLILIEGEIGCGKTFLANRIAYHWAKSVQNQIKLKISKNEDVKENWPKLVIQLDCALMEGSLSTAIQVQILGKNFKRFIGSNEKEKLILPETEREIWHMLEAYQDQILFVLDNYKGGPEPWLFYENWTDHVSKNHDVYSNKLRTKEEEKRLQTKLPVAFKDNELTKLLKGLILPKAKIILISHSLNVQPRINFQEICEMQRLEERKKREMPIGIPVKCNRHFKLFGLANKEAAIELIENYSELTKRPSHLFFKMIEHLGGKRDSVSGLLMRFPTDEFPPQDSPERERATNFCVTSTADEPEHARSLRIQRLIPRLKRMAIQNPWYLIMFCTMVELHLGVDLQNMANTIEHLITGLRLILIERMCLMRPVVNKAYGCLVDIAACNGSRRRLYTDLELSNGEKPSTNMIPLIMQFGFLEPIQNYAYVKRKEFLTNLNKEAESSGSSINNTKRDAIPPVADEIYKFRHSLIQDYLICKHLETCQKEETAKYFQTLGNNDLAPKQIWSRQLHNLATFYLHIKHIDTESSAIKSLLSKITEACTNPEDRLVETEEESKKQEGKNEEDLKAHVISVIPGSLQSIEQKQLKRLIRGLKRSGSMGTDSSYRILLECAYSIQGSNNDLNMLQPLIKALPAKLMVGFQRAPINDRMIRGLIALVGYQADVNQNKIKREQATSAIKKDEIETRITNKMLLATQRVRRQITFNPLTVLDLRLDNWALFCNPQSLEDLMMQLGRPMPQDKSRQIKIRWQRQTLDFMLRLLETVFSAHLTNSKSLIHRNPPENSIASLECIDETNWKIKNKSFKQKDKQEINSRSMDDQIQENLESNQQESTDSQSEDDGKSEITREESNKAESLDDNESEKSELELELEEDVELGDEVFDSKEMNETIIVKMENNAEIKDNQEEIKKEAKINNFNVSSGVSILTKNAFRSTSCLSHMAFKNCLDTAFVNTIIRNLPTTLYTLDLTGCHISYIASQSLVKLVKESQNLQHLILNEIRMCTLTLTSFVNEALPAKAQQARRRDIEEGRERLKGPHAISIRKEIYGLSELSLESYRHLDKVAAYGLAEAVIKTIKLQRLNLKYTKLSTDACSNLTRILQANTGLRELIVSNECISKHGKAVLEPYEKFRLVRIIGLKKTNEDGESLTVSNIESSKNSKLYTIEDRPYKKSLESDFIGTIREDF